MCGISGKLDISSKGLSGYDYNLSAALVKMKHRGPDSEDVYKDNLIELGHRRLSILDLSSAGIQPMADKSGRYVIVYNGEIYNYRSLYDELTDYPFKSSTDTEVILAAYAKWGADCVERLNGIFALAIWDSEKRELFLARDRLGIKPLYYFQDTSHFVFASEVRALLATGVVPSHIDRDAVAEYLQYYSVNSPDSMLAGMRQLEAGYYATVAASDGNMVYTRYWQPYRIKADVGKLARAEVVIKVRKMLGDAVERQLISDVQLGAFLSGGIDSSAIVALMAERSKKPVHTFSVTFDEPDFDESKWSNMVADKYKTEHHTVLLKPKDFLDNLPRALAAMDHPSGDGLNSFIVSEAAKKAGFTVALSGLGGDELFAGYDLFKRFVRISQMGGYYAVPLRLRKAAASMVGLIYRNHKSARLKQLMILPKNRFRFLYPVFRQITSAQEVDELFGVRGTASFGFIWDRIYSDDDLDQIEQMPLFSQATIGELSTYTQNVLLKDTDQMSMAHSLEVRVPFFDNELVDFVLSIEDEYKFPNYPKQLLVEAMGDLLPPEIVHRKKMGFVFPWEVWMRGELKEFCDCNLKELASSGLFDGKIVLSRWERFLKGDPRIHWMKIWMLVVLQSWIQSNAVRITAQG